uniref:Uncharacterized protein n=1 Tax=Wuchereria bancrofti TaxID=6293 RepID=A0AAF5Q192_WUCBA
MPTCMSFNESLIEETRLYYAKVSVFFLLLFKLCAQLQICALNDKLGGDSSSSSEE